MLKDDLAVNQKIEIKKDDDPINYKSYVQGVEDDKFAIAVPYHKGEPLILRRGDEIEVKLFTAKERYIFVSTVIARKQDQIPLYVLTLPEKAQRLQARDYVRVKVMLDVYYQVITEEEKNSNLLLNPTQKGMTVDLSGGGMLLALDDKLAENDLLYLEFTVLLKNKKRFFQTFGRVIRYDPAGGQRTKNLVGVKFEDIDERDRDDLIQFLFERMRAQSRLR